MNPNETRAVAPEKRHLTLLIIWGAILMNVVIFFVMANFIGPDPATLSDNRLLTVGLSGLGTFTALVSVFFRQKMLARAIEQRRPETVSSAYIVAFAMCEVAALCGLLLRLVTNDPYYYLLFIVAVIGLLLNFPRRIDSASAASGDKI